MVFFVYLDLTVFEEATSAGEGGLQALVATLRALLANCLLLDFDDWRWRGAVSAALREGDAVFARSQVKKLLVQMQKRNRIVQVIQSQCSGSTDLDLVMQQAHEAELDLVISGVADSVRNSSVPVVSLRDYQGSEFESERRAISDYGLELGPNEFDGAAFLDKYFRKALKHAKSIDVFDRLLGSKYSDSYAYTLKLVFELLGRSLANPQEVEMVLHCERSGRHQYLVDSLRKLRSREMPELKLSVKFYSDAASGQCLPHDRYLITDQFAFQIGRGFDMVDRKTRKNRDISVSLKNGEKLRGEKFQSYEVFAEPPVSIP